MKSRLLPIVLCIAHTHMNRRRNRGFNSHDAQLTIEDKGHKAFNRHLDIIRYCFSCNVGILQSFNMNKVNNQSRTDS